MKKIAVLTSGGDSPGMNAAIRSIVRTGIFEDMIIYGVQGGYQGLINGDLMELNIASVADIIQRGGTILGTSRSDEFETEEGLKKAMNILSVYGIEGLIVLGGDGSFRGALELSRLGMTVIGIPCTIDNDLGYTDYTIGFFTAVSTVTDAINKIRDTSSSHGRANVVEVMGRSCGDIALYAGIAGGAESIVVPEKTFTNEQVAKKTLEGKKRGKRHHIIVVAEGVGKPYEIAKDVTDITGIDTRVTILGYIQRGGAPNVTDRIMATAMGHEAVMLLCQNVGNCAMGVKNNEVFSMDLEKALEVPKSFNEDLYEVLKVVSI
ncbi:MAG: 6-phosphofructokinase [Tissierellia bacterium]|nr:6-phosphofructokinase [Tissierellia bacterium]